MTSGERLFQMSFFVPSFAQNLIAMKLLHLTVLLAGILAASSCFSEDQWLSAGRSRRDSHTRNTTAGGGTDPAAEDTVVLMSGVQFAEDYDWRMDSGYGQSVFEVILYENFKPCLQIPSSSGLVSPDPDTHHIIDMHLYTEFVSGGRTRLAKDGMPLLDFEGRELFKGILPDGENIYTISEMRDGKGFSLRLNGEVIFSRERGFVFGDLGDPSYRPYGALYKDDGKVCFCYRDDGGKDETYYYVIDGKAEDSGCEWKYDIQDLKVIGGYPVSAEASCLWFIVQEGRIWRGDGENLTLSGWMSYGGADNTSCTVTGDDPETLREICTGDALILHGGKTGYAILERPGTGVEIWSSDDDRNPIQRYAGLRLLSPSCAEILGEDSLYAVLAPEEGDSHLVHCHKSSRDMELHGYFTGLRVYAGLNPPK